MGKKRPKENKTQPEHQQDWKTFTGKLENIPFGTFADAHKRCEIYKVNMVGGARLELATPSV